MMIMKFLLNLSGTRAKKGKVFEKEKSEKFLQAEESLTHGFEKPTAPIIREVQIPETITVAELAKRMSVKAAELIKVSDGFRRHGNN